MEAYKPVSDAPLNYYTMENFKGVDFSNNPLMVKPYRSPDAKNIIPNKAGFPISRTGYEMHYQFTGEDFYNYLSGQTNPDNLHINGLHKVINYRKKENPEKYADEDDFDILIHINTAIFNSKDLDVTKMQTFTPLNYFSDPPPEVGALEDKKSEGVQFNDRYYIFDGKQAMVYGYNIISSIGDADIAHIGYGSYIPTTSISRDPKGGGTSFERINLIQPYKINEFLGTANDVLYQLEDNNIVDDAQFPVKVWVLNSNGDWEEKVLDVDFSVNTAEGLISFIEAPGESPVTGRDNIRVQYAVTYGWTGRNPYLNDYSTRITRCETVTSYGFNGNKDRLFVTGNPDYPNMDWYSETNTKLYFPDLNYTYVGQSNNKIVGYSHLGDGSLAIHKEAFGNEPTIYYRTSTTFNGEYAFALKSGTSNMGVIAPRATKQFINDPLILAKEGVYAITPVNNSSYNERYALKRSFFIDNRLTKEENLETAEAIVYNGYYYLAINNHIYVADSVQKSYIDRSEDYQYEWYYLDNIPVRCFLEYNNTLWFGTDDGRILYFKKESDTDAYKDNVNGELKPIEVYWKTPILNLGTFNRYKALKNLYIVPNPYNNSKINVDYIVKSLNNTVYTTVLESNVNIFDFSNIDFSDFSFDTDTGPRVLPTNRKAKKFVLIQFMLWANDGKPFGFYAISVTYTVGGKYKG